MNIIYKEILKIKSLPIKVIITMIALFLSILIYVYSISFLNDFIIEKSFLKLLVYVLSIYLSYFFCRFLALIIYSNTYNIKVKILEETESKEIIKWTYSKEESIYFRQTYISSIKKEMKYLYMIFFIIIGLPFFIIIFSNDNSLDLMFHTILLPLIILFSLRSFNSLKKALKRENITVVFSKIGFVVSESYTAPFNIKLKRLTNIKYNKDVYKITFTFSELSPSQDSADSIYTMIDEFPVPKRYEMDAEKIIREIQTYNSF